MKKLKGTMYFESSLKSLSEYLKSGGSRGRSDEMEVELNDEDNRY